MLLKITVHFIDTVAWIGHGTSLVIGLIHIIHFAHFFHFNIPKISMYLKIDMIESIVS